MLYAIIGFLIGIIFGVCVSASSVAELNQSAIDNGIMMRKGVAYWVIKVEPLAEEQKTKIIGGE